MSTYGGARVRRNRETYVSRLCVFKRKSGGVDDKSAGRRDPALQMQASTEDKRKAEGDRRDAAWRSGMQSTYMAAS